MIPNLTFYTDRFMPVGTAGRAYGPIITIRPEYRTDRGLHVHEEIHALQFWGSVGIGCVAAFITTKIPEIAPYWQLALVFGTSLHGLAYWGLPAYRLWAEVVAYKEQAKYYADDRKPLFAQFISRDYNLNITQLQALALLQKD